ncbi:dihydroneopterin triphosphate diphosphatase, partial [Salmonella enterica subsp. enterica serovar Eastbourne]|nr:dihydroneopterin triphosphate diphosphatase [Salmonella enterica subsp. enterica serovar Eastbourne]
EHWFVLCLPAPKAVPLTEHLAYEWLPAADAAAKTISPSNGEAIEEFVRQCVLPQ